MSRRNVLKSVILSGMGVASSALTAHGGQLRYLEALGDYLPDRSNEPDVILTGTRLKLLRRTEHRLRRLRLKVGYANFNLLSFDQALQYARNHSSVGAFLPVELSFMEEIFFADAGRYGFFGDKVFTEITQMIPKRDVAKILRSGHYLFRGQPLELYRKVQKEVGNTVILTSGVRGIVKQMHLFLAKAVRTKGNLSRASYSLAPPGYSYHGVGDFDIGRRGFGYKNFTEAFAKTDEFKRLSELESLNIRYPKGNPFGVRFEPWHIEVPTLGCTRHVC